MKSEKKPKKSVRTSRTAPQPILPDQPASLQAATTTGGAGEGTAGEVAGTTKPRKARAPRSTVPRPAARKRALKVPPILLEGDRPSVSAVGGPGQRYALGPEAPAQQFTDVEAGGELPESYGTQRLLLTARDPQWLYAHWDFSRSQLRTCNALSADRHLVLRIFADEVRGAPVTEVHVHPESRNWFVHVGRGGARFVGELGYYALKDRRWVRLSVSAPTLTPPDTLSADLSVQFATIPIDMPFEQLVALVRTAVQDHVPLAEAILQLRASGRTDLPGARQIAAEHWTPAQERALAELISIDQLRRVWIGSLEVTELIRRQLERQISSAALPLGVSSLGISSISSPFGGIPGRRGFWFNVNAELIIYGATEPDATVTIGGRPIQLRRDGTFSYRFALPDGQYELPAVAVSADQEDSRRAELRFSRRTSYAGEVGAHPQDPALKTPHPQHVA